LSRYPRRHLDPAAESSPAFLNFSYFTAVSAAALLRKRTMLLADRGSLHRSSLVDCRRSWLHRLET
jgi:hypothetical protein